MIFDKKISLSLILALLLVSSFVQRASCQESIPKYENWQNKDLLEDGFFGVSTEKAYHSLLNGKSWQEIIVAVIDGGVDIRHEDLKSVIWTNKKEIPDNHIDDDKNGYIDDIHGWNFLASPKGSFQYENLDIVRDLRAAIRKNPKGPEVRKLQRELSNRIVNVANELNRTRMALQILNEIVTSIPSVHPTEKDFRNFIYKSYAQSEMLVKIVQALKSNKDYLSFKSALQTDSSKFSDQIKYYYNIDYNPRDSGNETNSAFLGNNDVIGLLPYHATHICGIIGAVRNNGVGINGVADHVKIMPLRTIPSGDYLDDDLANAIYYATNNGAKIINMSFIKRTTSKKASIDKAIRYAIGKDVLFVHGCGNNGERISSIYYPSRKYLEGKEAKAWIEVGASNKKDDINLLAAFSNYGKDFVDIMAPGVDIYSTIPVNTYTNYNGTSMAAPIITGMAGIIRAYYPQLRAEQVKDIILRSVVPVNHTIKTGNGQQLPFVESCLSGGIANVYNALKLAATF